jgi:hypothetical protein
MSENFEYLDTDIDAWINQCIEEKCDDVSKLPDLEHFFFPFIRGYLKNQEQSYIPLLFEYFLSRILSNKQFWETIRIPNLKISQFANIYSGVIEKTISIYYNEVLTQNDNIAEDTPDYFRTKSFSTGIGELTSTDYTEIEERTPFESITTSTIPSIFVVHELQLAENQAVMGSNLTFIENISNFDSIFTPKSIEVILAALGKKNISFNNIDESYWRTEYEGLLEDPVSKGLKFSIRKLLLYKEYCENQKQRLKKLE